MEFKIRWKNVRYRLKGFWVGVISERSYAFTTEGSYSYLNIWVSVVPFFPVLIQLKWKDKFPNA